MIYSQEKSGPSHYVFRPQCFYRPVDNAEAEAKAAAAFDDLGLVGDEDVPSTDEGDDCDGKAVGLVEWVLVEWVLVEWVLVEWVLVEWVFVAAEE
jgi:hypothetical protein